MDRGNLAWPQVMDKLAHDGVAWLETSELELELSSGRDLGYAPVPVGLDQWQPQTFGPDHLDGDLEQFGSDGIGGWVPMPSLAECQALEHDDDFMLSGGALVEVIDGEPVAMDPAQVDRMRRRLKTLRAHEIADDFRELVEGPRG